MAACRLTSSAESGSMPLMSGAGLLRLGLVGSGVVARVCPFGTCPGGSCRPPRSRGSARAWVAAAAVDTERPHGEPRAFGVVMDGELDPLPGPDRADGHRVKALNESRQSFPTRRWCLSVTR